MIEIKLSQLVNSLDGLKQLSQSKIPVEMAFTLGLMIKQLDPHIKSYLEIRQQVCERLGTVSEDGKQFNFDEESAQQYNKEMDELGSQLVEVPVEKQKVKDLGKECTFTPADAVALDWLFEV